MNLLYLKVSFVVLSIFVTISHNKCPKFQLIQPLDKTTGLSYAVIAGGKYYLVSNETYNKNNSLIKGIEMPKGFEDPHGVMAYKNSFCSPQYHLMAYRVFTDEMGRVFDWHTVLDLIGWNSSRKWTAEVNNLPDYLQNDGFMNSYKMTFTMFWQKRNSLILVQLPESGAPSNTIRNYYHTIKQNAQADCSDEKSKHQYFEDPSMKFIDVLKPYEDFDSCFIHDDRQVICFGHKLFSTYDIDLNETKDGQLRVKNASKEVPNIPIVQIITDICKESETEIPTVSFTTITESTSSSPPIGNDYSPLIWFILLVLLLALILFLLSLWYYCKRQKPKEQLPEFPLLSSPSMTYRSDVSPSKMSGHSMRSEINGKNKMNALNESQINSQLSMRSETNAKNKGKVMAKDQSAIESNIDMRSKTNDNKDPNKGLTNISTSGPEMSMRSQVNPNTRGQAMVGNSAVDSKTSTRSQTNPKDIKDLNKDLTNVSGFGPEMSMRSEVNKGNTQNTTPIGSSGGSAINSSTSKRSQTTQNSNDQNVKQLPNN